MEAKFLFFWVDSLDMFVSNIGSLGIFIYSGVFFLGDIFRIRTWEVTYYPLPSGTVEGIL